MQAYRALFPVLGIVLLASISADEARSWVSEGVPVCTANGTQLRVGVIPDGDGGAVVTWTDGRDLGRDLYAQRITSEGEVAPGWPENGVFLAAGLGELWIPLGIPDGSGGAIVAWEDERDVSTSLHNIFAQRVTGDGVIAPGWPSGGLSICAAPKDQRAPRLVSDGAGGAIITWYDRRDEVGPDPSPDIYAQRVTADGAIAPLWPQNGLAVCTTLDGQWEPVPASDGAGGAIVSWYDGRDRNTSGADIYAQRITASGEVAAGWMPEGVPVSVATGHQIRPWTVTDGHGGVIVIWQDGRTDPDFDIYALRITGQGTVAPGWPLDGVPLCRAPHIQQALSASADGLGGAIVAWEDYRSHFFQTGTASDIYGQRITADGIIPPGWPPDGAPLCTAPSFQIIPRLQVLAPDGTGGAFVVWEDPRSGNEEVYAQHVTASGAVAFGWQPDGLAVCTQPSSQPAPVLAADGAGGAVVTWSDLRNGNSDVFAHKLGLDGPVSVILSLESAETEVGRVLLRWSGIDAASVSALVHRRTESTEWQVLGAPEGEGPDRLRYEDRSVVPGTRYSYRLSYRGEAGEQFTAETWVDVPSLSLSLAGFEPNPSRGRVVRLALPSSEAATLEVFDARGRVVLSREVGSLGPGSHAVDLSERGYLGPAIYWLRLVQAGRVVTAKGVVLP